MEERCAGEALEARTPVDFESPFWAKVKEGGKATVIFMCNDGTSSKPTVKLELWEASRIESFANNSKVFARNMYIIPTSKTRRKTRSSSTALEVHLVYADTLHEQTVKVLRSLVHGTRKSFQRYLRGLERSHLDEARLELSQLAREEGLSLQQDLDDAWEASEEGEEEELDESWEDSQPAPGFEVKALIYGMSKTPLENVVWGLEDIPALVNNKTTAKDLQELKEYLGVDATQRCPEYIEIPSGEETAHYNGFVNYLKSLGGQGKELIVTELSQDVRTQLRALLQTATMKIIFTGNTDILIQVRQAPTEQQRLRATGATWELKTTERAGHSDTVSQTLMQGTGAVYHTLQPVLALGGDAHEKVIMMTVRRVWKVISSRREPHIAFDVYVSDSPAEALPILKKWMELSTSAEEGLPESFHKGHELLRDKLSGVDVFRLDVNERRRLELEEEADKKAREEDV